MSETLAARRRWYQFGLRTMFVVVTAVAGWLSWELRYMQKRRDMRQEIKDESVRTQAVLKQLPMWGGVDSWRNVPVNESVSFPPQIPAWRRWLGDAPLDLPFVVRHTRADAIRTSALFPETNIGYYGGPLGMPPDRARVMDQAFGVNSESAAAP
jgi:hypothetical protein